MSIFLIHVIQFSRYAIGGLIASDRSPGNINYKQKVRNEINKQVMEIISVCKSKNIRNTYTKKYK